MTKLTKTMLKYLLSVYDNADPVTRYLWKLRVMIMSDKQVMDTYYQLTDRR